MVLCSLPIWPPYKSMHGSGPMVRMGLQSMLLRSLARMPTLEVLSLRNCFFAPTPSTRISTRVHLPNLKQFEVASTLQDCICFLQQVTVNASAVVHLDIRSSKMTMADVEKFFTIFPSRLFTTPPPIARELQFTWRDRDTLRIFAWTIQPNTTVTYFLLVFKSESTPPTLPRRMPPLDLTWTCFSSLASPQLRSFHILGGDIASWDIVEWGVEDWRELAQLAPNLQHLSPGRGALSVELCKALSPPDAPDLHLADCCFPALSRLRLAVPSRFPVPTQDGGETPLSAILDRSLTKRAVIGCPTPKVVFLVSNAI